MKAEVKLILSNDTTDEASWRASDPANHSHWFSVDIGPVGEDSCDIFQVCVATPLAIRDRRIKRPPFKGLVLDRFAMNSAKRLIRNHVASKSAPTWEGLVEQLRETMSWEYDRA